MAGRKLPQTPKAENTPDVKSVLDAVFLPKKSTTVTSYLEVPDKALQKIGNESVRQPELNVKLPIDNFLPPELEILPHAAKDVIKRLLEFDPKQRLRSVLSLQRIALYQNYKIDSKHLLSISPIDIISKDNIISCQPLSSAESSSVASKAFQSF